ncbi:MAG: DNA polymerase III subunit alpha [Myxococcales bacterium]
MKPPYCELRALSAFSFLRSTAMPEALAARAAELGYDHLALTDVDGFYGAPRFWAMAKEKGLRPLVGVDLGLAEGEGAAGRLLLLAKDASGYQRLCRLATLAHARGAGSPGFSWEELEVQAGGLVALTGGSGGLLWRALEAGDEAQALRLADRLCALFGRENVLGEIQRHGDPRQERLNRRMVDLAASRSLRVVATNGVRLLEPADLPLLDVLTCIRNKVTLDGAGTLLARNGEQRLKRPAEMAALFADQPQAVAATLDVARECVFTFDALPYRFPDFPVPPGASESALLRGKVEEGARRLYRPLTPAVRAQLDRELALIEKLGLAGYFLIVADIIDFCRRERILAKGRGSAANSAVCYTLDITCVDPVGNHLLFERFLSEERAEWPDIDIDLPSGVEREKVLQYVFATYGKRRAAMCAEVITYRDRSAAREVGKALGFGQPELERFAKGLVWFEPVQQKLTERLRGAGLSPGDPRVRLWGELCGRIQDLPRHLSQHSGGVVIAAGHLDEVVPIQPARMPGRSLIQWDKDDAESLGLIKIDLLGLGMLAALQEAQELVRVHEVQGFDVAHLPPDDPAVYDACNERFPDTIGVFQIESRAQIATLPRQKPRCFYDLVIEVGLIRPGPLVGKMVSPYLRRRAGREAVTYLHPSLEPILGRTLGFPLFQEQLLRVAMALAGFSGGDAEALRRAMTHKRSSLLMAGFARRFKEGAVRSGLSAEKAEEAWSWFDGFAQYGFPESHAYAFAYWVYASAYLKVHHPAVFLVSLLNAQPMGFYSPATLVKDAQRHGVAVLPPDVARSGWKTTIEAGSVRLGLSTVQGLGAKAGERFELERLRSPFRSPADLADRCGLSPRQMALLAEAGALSSFAPTRRSALWEVTLATGGPLFSGARGSVDRAAPPLPEMDAYEETLADYRTAGVTVGPQVVAHHREELDRAGVTRAAGVLDRRHGLWTRIGGLVIARQHPTTVRGLVFVTVEDETGHANAVVLPEIFARHRELLLEANLLVIEGPLQNVDGVATVQARKLWRFGRDVPAPRSHDFH